MTKKKKKIKSEDSNIELIKKELKKTKGGFDFSACESKNLNEFFTYYEKDKNKIPFDKNTIIKPYSIRLAFSEKVLTVHFVIWLKRDSAGTKMKVSIFAITVPELSGNLLVFLNKNPTKIRVNIISI